MDDTQLLSYLQLLEEDAADYTFGQLASDRRKATLEYFRRPYGNEEDGWSQVVTSDVQDTIEWLLPELLKIFISSEDAVVFDPTREAEVKGAQQATDACNYVFYKQNSGFLVLYTAFKDALMYKNCAIHWRKETVRSKETIPVRGATELTLAATMQEGDEIEGIETVPSPLIDPATGQPAIGPDGQPMMQTLLNAKIARITERQVIKVDAFEPECLLVKRDWTSPLLHDCPYVARNMLVTLSDLHVMGYKDVTAEELAGSAEPGNAADSLDRRDRTGRSNEDVTEAQSSASDDESLSTGWLRIEWVLVDADGDGIAERREIWRLKDKILSSEECSQVPVATGSPILVQHRVIGQSIWEIVSDLQKLRTDLTRGVVNNASLANNPRKTVMVDSHGAPMASIEDLLDGRPGGVVQTWGENAIGVEATPYVGNQMQPLLAYVDEMREQRTGLTKQRMGIDPNALRGDRTLGETQIIDDASKQRTELIARMFAEVLVKPVFQGILKLLTEGGMEKIAFKLRGEFVELDPNEWRDSYDMTINVGLGTGDKKGQMAVLNGVKQTQLQLAQSPLGPMMVTPKQIYNTNAKMLDLSGFKNVGDYLTDPGDAKLPEKQEGPPPQVMVKQMELQAESQRFQAETARDMRKLELEDQRATRAAEAQNAVQLANDERDAQRQREKDAADERIELAKIEAAREKVLADNRTKIIVARIAHPEGVPPNVEFTPEGDAVEVDPMEPVMQALGYVADMVTAPKSIVRDENGRPVGVQHGQQMRPIVRDENGRVVGLQ
ncbi:hypothetical protein WDL1CHR_02092 [Variovorax sp. WDL1]|nr:hypothetical protein CHC06_04531 [Variovorax sp. B2]PNG53758.1 hypothetical protein CHC07_03578 [Variovorax sp. B4]VTV11210.1 hypothetical protein WDL1CHR_02092 [Variovorax sp. WDL1]